MASGTKSTFIALACFGYSLSVFATGPCEEAARLGAKVFWEANSAAWEMQTHPLPKTIDPIAEEAIIATPLGAAKKVKGKPAATEFEYRVGRKNSNEREIDRARVVVRAHVRTEGTKRLEFCEIQSIRYD